MMKEDTIKILGARVHNLKNIDLEIPRRKLVVITGLSGSGKSSLAFDTIYAEGQRRYMETLSTYARQFVGTMERPDVDKITGLSPVVAIEQKTTNKNPRSTVGTVTEINDFLRLLYARASRAYSPATGEEMVHYSDEQILDLILRDLDLIKTFPDARVSWSVNTLDEDFKNDMDNAVSIARRLAAMEAFYRAGIRTTCFVSRPHLLPLYQEIYNRGDRSYWETLDQQLRTYADKIGLYYVTDDDSVRRPFDAPPVIVNYFYHEKIKKSAKRGK